MERVGTLLEKLQQQYQAGASAAQLLLTAQMLEHQLMYLQNSIQDNQSDTIEISMPVDFIEVMVPNDEVIEDEPATPLEEEKTIEILQVDEAAIEAELEEIKRNAAAMQKISAQSKPQLLFDTSDDEIPTLSHQHLNKKQAVKEINETVANTASSLNDTLKREHTDLVEKLTDTPVKDLKKAIGVNERFLYISELFRGDEAMYERSIKTINSFAIWPEAEYWIRRELKVKLGWQDSNEIVKQFDQLVIRRFS